MAEDSVRQAGLKTLVRPSTQNDYEIQHKISSNESSVVLHDGNHATSPKTGLNTMDVEDDILHNLTYRS